MQEDFCYLPVSRRDRQWGLYVTGVGVVLNGEPRSGSVHPQPYFCQWDRGRVLPEYAAVYHPHSSLEMESETTPYGIVPPGNFVFVCRDVWHRYRPVKEPNWTEYWVCFGGSYADQLVREGFFTPKVPLHQVGSDARLIGPYRRLLDQVRSASPLGLPQLLAASLTEILGTALAFSRAGCSGDVNESIVQKAKGTLERHIEEHIDMQELASSLGISYSTFRQLFKQLTGNAPYQYRLQLRLGRAKQLLVESELSVKEIAGLLKFDDSYHLSKMFKRHTGMSPSDWRSGTLH